ncbi:MAG: trypsin-like peptidase domain-containing protein [Candidatus Limnocylindrales bacterium]|jgi:S1-C subfamily serine protease
MGALEELSAVVAKVAGLATPAVVGIGGRWRRGSGVVVAENRVLTNAHNVHGDDATCVFADGRRARGRLLGEDVDGDLAVLEVDTGGAAPLEWADAKSVPQVGSVVFAVASAPSGGGRATVGMVSGVARSFRGPGGRLIGGSIEHTAPLAPGSSGSPIVDGEGRLLGLNTQRIGEGFYLALPADEGLRARIDALGRGESTVRPRLGIAVAPGHIARHLRRAVGLPDRDGVLVRGVEEDSPAEAAGIREGDLIVSAGGAAIEDPDGLHEALSKAGSGKLDVGLVRGVEELTVKVDLGRPASGGESPKNLN